MIDIDTYRKRIGTFSPKKRRGKMIYTMVSKKMLVLLLFAFVIQNVLIACGDVEQNPGPNECLCCAKPLENGRYYYFDKENYPLDNETLHNLCSRQTLKHRTLEQEVCMCIYCHKSLKNGRLCHGLGDKKKKSKVQCICCKEWKKKNKQLFRYDPKNFDFEKDYARKIFPDYSNYTNEENVYICQSCCRQVNKPLAKKRNWDVDAGDINSERKRARLSTENLEVANTQNVQNVSNAVAHDHCYSGERRQCTSCHREMKSMHRFSENEYDFENENVKKALSSAYRIETGWICFTCRKNLKQPDPKMPQKAVAYIKERGAINFLKARKELPEYVCTCCHKIFFLKSVREFKDSQYDWEKDKVNRALAAEYRYKSEHKDKEYICCTCKSYLRPPRHTIPRIPPQAVANGLALPDIPPELRDLSDMERRLISLRIPFMKILAMFKYGSHYKVNGPCVNVPSTVEMVSTLLPRLPDQAQVIPIKLKRKVIYKGHHMFGNIRKDVVVNALKWLIRNNPLYKDIEFNNMWNDQFMADELGKTITGEITSDGTLVNDTANHDQYSEAKLPNGDSLQIREESSSDNELVNDKDKEETFYMFKSIDGDNIVMSRMEFDELKALAEARYPTLPWALPNEALSRRGQIHVENGIPVLVLAPGTQTLSERIEAEREENELKEDQAAADRNAEISGHPLSSCLQLNNIEDSVYSLAPGEGNVPKFILMDKDFEALAFPDLFPDGSGVYESGEFRDTRLTLKKYFQQRVLNVDGRFARNIEYIAAAQYMTELKQLQMDTSVRLKITKGRMHNGQPVTAEMLKCPELLRELIRKEQAFKCLEKIRGSPAYWKHQLHEVLAMIRTLGIPTWFLTLSAADLHWPEIIQAITAQYGPKATEEEVLNMSWQTKSNYLRSNPVTGCFVFQHMVESFFKHYIKSPDNPIGQVTDYVIKIEFQERGTPHAHCLIWVKDSPKVGVASDQEVCDFIDQHISGSLPTDDPDLKDMLLKYETHAHSAYCRRSSGACRFGFPKAPSTRTIISREPEDDINKGQILKDARETLGKVHEAIEGDQNSTLDEVLKKAGVTEEKYMSSLKVTNSGQSIILQRSPADTYTNGCSHRILQLWRANIDFQFVVDAYSTVMYVIGYMMKTEKEMGELLKRVAKESRNDDISLQMKKLGAVFSGKRVVGLPESVYRLFSSLWLICKTRTIVYINNASKEHRSSMPKPQHVIDKMADDDEDIFMTSLHDRYEARPELLNDMCLAEFAVTYTPRKEGNAGNVNLQNNGNEDDLSPEIEEYVVNDAVEDEGYDVELDDINDDIQHDDVQEDPINQQITQNENQEDMISGALDDNAQPAIGGALDDNAQPAIEDDDVHPKKITLKNGLGEMRKRKKIAIARSHKFNQLKEPDDYYRGQLMLYWPWKDESELGRGYESLQEHYIAQIEIIKANAEKFGNKTQEVDDAVTNIDKNGPPEAVWDAVAPAIEEENVKDKQEGYYALRNMEEDDLNDHNEMWKTKGGSTNTTPLSKVYTIEAKKTTIADPEYRQMYRSLNPQQRKMVQYHRNWCKRQLWRLNQGLDLEPYKAFLSGFGGTGKTYVIDMIRRDTIYFFKNVYFAAEDVNCRRPDQPLLLVTAPTGSAAFQIDGLTVHYALKVSEKNTPLSQETISCLQNKLKHLKLLIIDEVSMVGSPLLRIIHERLCMITEKRDENTFNFGNVSVLAIGDLYQLPPVKSTVIYKRPSVGKKSKRSSMDQLGTIPWHEFQFHELTQSMRQKELEFSDILTSIRSKQPEEGSKEDRFLTTCEVCCGEDDPLYPKNAMHLYAENKYVALRNRKMLESLPGQIFIVKAKDSKKDGHTNTADCRLPDNPTKTGNLIETLYVKIGARVMLTRNLDVPDGLTNGAMGTVVNLVLKKNSTTDIHCILVKFDNSRVGEEAIARSHFSHISRSAVPIYRVQETFGKGKGDAFAASRIQFPLFLSWAVTVHKCQGMTVDEVVVDMSKGTGSYHAGQAYVAFSRVRNQNKLHIINYDREKIKVDEQVHDEMQRLRNNPLPDIEPPQVLQVEDDYILVGHLNIDRITHKMLDIVSDCNMKKTNVMCFTESKLKSSQNVTPEMLGFNNDKCIFRFDRVSDEGGGIVMVVDRKLKPTVIDTTHFKEEILFVKVFNPQETNIICTYCRPNYSGVKFMENIGGVLDLCNGQRTIVLGDFNENLLKSSVIKKATKKTSTEKPISRNLCKRGYTQHVQTPTRHYGTLLDHVYTQHINDVSVDVVDCYYSDHDTVYCWFKET